MLRRSERGEEEIGLEDQRDAVEEEMVRISLSKRKELKR